MIELKFTVKVDGRAHATVIDQADYRGSTLEKCLARAMGRVEFPEGFDMKISYPFVLEG